MSAGTIDRLYSNLINDLEYKDLPETEKARKKFKASVMSEYLSADDEEAYKQWLGMEKLVEEVAGANEYQGFVYGFKEAMGLFISGEKICGRNRLEENISSEYSTLAVEDIDRTDKVVDILKEYVPEEKFTNTVDVLCACVNETKYAVFEQGFLRGIAVAKGGVI